jgi:hypothetical protein
MKRRAVLFMGVCLAVVISAQGYGQEESAVEEETGKGKERKELKFGATPFVFSDPNTGFGGTVIYTTNKYETYMIDLTEPHLFTENGWGKIYISLDSAPIKRFYGPGKGFLEDREEDTGNDSLKDNICNWRSHSFTLEPRYTYWFKPTVWGMRIQFNYEDYKPQDSNLDVDEEDDSTRPISDIWPEVFESEEFQEGGLFIGPALSFVHDSRKDRFPVGGGREEKVFPTRGGRQELSMSLYDPTFGSDYSFSSVSFDARHFFPLSEDELTVLGIRARLISNGGDTPFWKLPGFGAGDSLRGYHSSRFIDNHSVLFNVELRQAIDVATTLFKGAITLRAPMLVLFYDYGRVYEDLKDVTDELYGFHDSYGAAFRFIVTPSIVIRFEYAWSEEETDFYVNSGHAF